jgi:hypothetical protein
MSLASLPPEEDEEEAKEEGDKEKQDPNEGNKDVATTSEAVSKVRGERESLDFAGDVNVESQPSKEPAPAHQDDNSRSKLSTDTIASPASRSRSRSKNAPPSTPVANIVAADGTPRGTVL